MIENNNKKNNYNQAVEESLKRQAELEKYALENLSFSYISGSRLYGTNISSSDTDIRGVFLHSIDKVFSILKEDDITEVTFTGDNDQVFFEFKSFAAMLREQKPNAIEALWIPENNILQDSGLYYDLRNNKEEFTSHFSLEKMLGFAASQFKMAQRFEKKHFDKEMKEPLRQDFLKILSNPQNINFGNLGFPIENTCAVKAQENPNLYYLYSSEHIDNKNHSWITEDNNFLFVRNKTLEDKPILAIVEFQSEDFKQAFLSFKNFTAWKENGNMEKLLISENIGYQPKPMMHALRNLYMANEFIDTGKIVLMRKEHMFLKDIRAGIFSLDECKNFYNELNNQIKSKRESFKLQEFNNKLITEILRDHYLEHFNLVSKNIYKNKNKL
jgi:uncharacterized protein